MPAGVPWAGVGRGVAFARHARLEGMGSDGFLLAYTKHPPRVVLRCGPLYLPGLPPAPPGRWVQGLH